MSNFQSGSKLLDLLRESPQSKTNNINNPNTNTNNNESFSSSISALSSLSREREREETKNCINSYNTPSIQTSRIDHKVKKSSSNNVKGWKTKDGNKCYISFRDGKKIVATGSEAYLLARADEGKRKQKPERSEKGLKQKKLV